MPNWPNASPTPENASFDRLEGIDNQCVYFCDFVSSFTGNGASSSGTRKADNARGKSETGYYAFGARYYDCDLSGIFLSVDPMADKYPNISPYAYCAWNPVKLVDPDGEEIGDYYNQNGKYLGWDGKNDYNVYIVTNKKSISTIVNNNTNKKVTNTEDVDIAVSTNYFVLKQADKILNLAIQDNGKNEYCVSMSGVLSSPIVKGDGKSCFLPNTPDQSFPFTSIHSHVFSDDQKDHWIEYMSTGLREDSHAFQSYDLNIIFGQRSTGTGYGAAFYNRQPLGDESAHPPVLTITQESLNKIANGKPSAMTKQQELQY